MLHLKGIASGALIKGSSITTVVRWIEGPKVYRVAWSLASAAAQALKRNVLK